MDMSIQQRIEFTVEELLILRSTDRLRIAMEVCFLYGSDEAFHALCSRLLFGKDICSPNKRVKADAKLDFYNKLLVKHHPNCKQQPQTGRMTYSEFAISLQSMNDRWATTYPIDELISLAFIVDIDEKRFISYDAYLRFTEEVEKAARTHINEPKEGLDSLYDHRRETLYKHVMVAIDMPELRDKLALLAVLASQCSMQPLQSLHELQVVSDQEASLNDSLIGFLLELSDAVNNIIDAKPDTHGSSIDVITQPTHLIAEHSCIDDILLTTGIDTGDSRDSSASSTKQPNASKGIIDPISLQSAASVITVVHEDASQAADILAPHPLTERSIACDDGSISSSSSAHSIHRTVCDVTDTSIEHRDEGDGEMRRKETLLQTIMLMQKEMEEMSSQLLSRDTSTRSSESIALRLDSLENDLKHAVDQMKSLLIPTRDANTRIDEERKHQPQTQSDTRQSDAAESSSPIVTLDSSTTPVSTIDSRSPPLFYTGSPIPLSTSKQAATTLTPVLKRPNTTAATTTMLSNSSIRGKGTGSNGGGGPSHPMAINRVLLATTTSSSSASKHSFPYDSLISNRDSMMSTSTGSGLIISRSMRRIDMDIFKSPRRHQTSRNRNTFSESKLTWMPSQETIAAHERKRSDRFHSTEELMFARKINQVFYKGD